MRQSAEPLAKDGLDLGSVECVGDSLHPTGIIARPDPVIQRLEGDPAVGQLALQPLVSIQTELRRVREVEQNLMNSGPKSRSRMYT
jgi:hypothetical protein